MSLLMPDRYVASIDLIDLDELAAQGVRCILFDRDNTVVPRDAMEAPPEVSAWLDRARAMGLRCIMVSNNWYRDRVRRSAGELGVEGIHTAMKPLPFNIRRACARLGVPPEQAVLVGDQLFTDILGGNLAGVRTILVRPQCELDVVPMRYLRSLERRIIGDTPFEGEGAPSEGDDRP